MSKLFQKLFAAALECCLVGKPLWINYSARSCGNKYFSIPLRTRSVIYSRGEAQRERCWRAATSTILSSAWMGNRAAPFVTVKQIRDWSLLASPFLPSSATLRLWCCAKKVAIWGAINQFGPVKSSQINNALLNKHNKLFTWGNSF
jgi:hypothetical protein